jgi:hypothetical protein
MILLHHCCTVRHDPLSLMTFLTHDWWGVTNAISMLVSVVVRCMLVKQTASPSTARRTRRPEHVQRHGEDFLTLPSGKAVTIHVPRGVPIQCLLTSPRPPNPQLYHAARALGWLAFGCHIISLGMATSQPDYFRCCPRGSNCPHNMAHRML